MIFKNPKQKNSNWIIANNEGKELDVHYEICKRITREHIMKMRWNDPLLSYVVDVSKCDFLRRQFTVNEWNQIAQNPQNMVQS